MAASAVDKGESETRGPLFSSARTIVFSELSDADKEKYYSFLVDTGVQFFKDADGSYCANVRMVEKDASDELLEEAGRRRSRGLGGSAGRGGSRGGGEDGRAARGQLFDFSVYPKFCSLITLRDSLQPKKRPVAWLLRLVEEIYDTRYARDTADLKDEDPEETERLSSSFPVFVIDFFSKRYGLRQLVEQTCWDLLYNVHVLRKEHLEVEIFARFLEEYYDPDDLLFFLYVRSVTQKELGISFKQMWTEAGRGRERTPSTVFVSYRECVLISRVVFGSEADPMFRTFMSMIEGHLVGSRRGKTDTRRIDVVQFLQLALVEYHEMGPEDGGGGGGGGGGGVGAAGAGSSGDAPSARDTGDSAGASGGLGAPGSGGGISREEQERLLREAEAQYEDRVRMAGAAGSGGGSGGGGGGGGGGAEAPPAPPPAWSAPPAPPSAGAPAPVRAAPPAAPSGGGAEGRATAGGDGGQQLLQALDLSMQRAAESYLGSLMTQGADLPAEVQGQIANEVRQQLEAKVDAVLGAVINASKGPAEAVAGNELAAMFSSLRDDGVGSGGRVDDFCDAVLATSEVRGEIEPLVALLVTYAKTRLEEEGGGQ